MPEGAKILDRVQAAFLWGGAELKRELHMVKWGEVTKNMINGGLGIKDIREFNDCLLAKWWWRFGKEDDSMWKIVLCAKYASAGGNWFPFVDELCRLSGHRIRFWVDTWFGSHSLCSEFPRPFSLSVEKEVSLCTIVERKSRSEEWVFNFHRVLKAWEVEELGLLRARLDAENFHLSAEEDRLCWKPSPSGMHPQLDLLSDRVKVRIALWIALLVTVLVSVALCSVSSA
ncbi:uncharacterized protein LOC114307948 [Camellia sinensis]|uniref:uncharacterized protein LOC114307948 n=1 Tax=Camellia sinensis TaxID=4442 RepID=UPI0010364947|nr:uncharacterized protein LOC114307948 [Camellia sinensis]